jgi:hypothetical protein
MVELGVVEFEDRVESCCEVPVDPGLVLDADDLPRVSLAGARLS